VATDPPTRARVTLPSWLWGGNPRRLLQESELHARADGAGSFLVQTDESYYQRPVDVVRLRTIATPGETRPRWGDLAHFPERVEVPLGEHVGTHLQRRQLKAEESGELIHLINHQSLLLHALPARDLPVQSRYFMETLNEVRFSEDPTSGPFPNTGVYFVEVSTALLHRVRLASVWLRIEQDVRLGGGDMSHLKRTNGNDDPVFASSAGLYDGLTLLEAYLAPLLAAGTPGVWAVNVVRSFGVLVFSFGTFISGTDGDAAELLQLVSLAGPRRAVDFPRISAHAGHAALKWWTERLNQLFGVLGDLATFTDERDDYRPEKHLEALLTVEQIFRRTTSMLVAHRDANARRALSFTILDSLEGLRGVDLLTMFRLKHATKVLAGLEAALPPEAAEILLPAARRAVSALREMQDGFFIRRQLSTPRVELQLGGGATRSLSTEEATALYLKVLRDATHGHGSNKDSSKAQTAALLAHHDGEVPHDVGLLGYLYLLDVLSNPERSRIANRTSRSPHRGCPPDSRDSSRIQHTGARVVPSSRRSDARRVSPH
jgi:hypothetical protein